MSTNIEIDFGNNFIPANTEQEEAITTIVNFIKKGDSSEWFTLQGKAGVGKTTVVIEALRPFISKKRIMVSALSHKAKKVILNKILDTCVSEPRGLENASVASMLSMSFDLETGKFVKQYTRKKAPIKMMDIIVVDESSMINEEGLQLIMSEKKKSAKVIFLGDIGQLPPIREGGDNYQGELSPTFKTKNKFELNERVRQSKESTILPYSDHYWNNSVISDEPVEDPVPFEDRVTDEHMVFTKDLEATIKSHEKNFKLLKDPKKQDLIKVIVYKNKTREMLNWYIRNLIYGEPKEYEIGDVLIFNDNYNTYNDDLIENSTEVTVVELKNDKFNGKWDGYTLNVTDGVNFWDIEVISNTSINDYNRYVSELFKRAKSFPHGRVRNNSLKVAWDAKRRFANVDFGYVITSHKSQGSTYKYVIVVEDDILSVKPITDVEKSQSIYTAITRASDKVWIVSDYN